jgi:hypothetical protein
MTVCGEVDGSNFKTDMVGKFLDFEDDVYISPSAKANLLSFSLVSKLFEITWDQDEQMFIVTTPQEKLFFRNVDVLFVCDVRRDIIKLNQSQSYLVKSASETKPDEAQLLMKKLGYPPAAAMVKLLQHGGISGISIRMMFTGRKRFMVNQYMVKEECLIENRTPPPMLNTFSH